MQPPTSTTDEDRTLQAQDELAKKSAVKTILFGVAAPEQPKRARHPYELITEDDDDKRPVR